MGAVFVQKLNDLGFLLHHTAVAHGDNGALPVIGVAPPAHRPGPGGGPGPDRADQSGRRRLSSAGAPPGRPDGPPPPAGVRRYFRPRMAADAIKQAAHASGSSIQGGGEAIGRPGTGAFQPQAAVGVSGVGLPDPGQESRLRHLAGTRKAQFQTISWSLPVASRESSRRSRTSAA